MRHRRSNQLNLFATATCLVKNELSHGTAATKDPSSFNFMLITVTVKVIVEPIFGKR